MNTFLEFVSNPNSLAHAAAGLYALGLLTRNQILLRVLILLGTGFYIAYYYLAPAVPLWEAIIWSCVLGSANIYVLAGLTLDRTTFALSSWERALYAKFPGLAPGEFRRLMRSGTWIEGDGVKHLTIEGEKQGHLFCTLDGLVNIHREGEDFAVEGGCFIGEIAYLLNTPATATVTAAPGTWTMRWEFEALRKLELRYPALRIAIRDAFNVDMARKVARTGLVERGSDNIFIATSTPAAQAARAA